MKAATLKFPSQSVARLYFIGAIGLFGLVVEETCSRGGERCQKDDQPDEPDQQRQQPICPRIRAHSIFLPAGCRGSAPLCRRMFHAAPSMASLFRAIPAAPSRVPPIPIPRAPAP